MAFAWASLPVAKRQRICRDYGFSDYITYANYAWHHFQPHTRAALLVEVLKATKLPPGDCCDD